MSSEDLGPHEERSLRAALAGAVPPPPRAPHRGARAARAGRRHRLAVVGGSVVASLAAVAALALVVPMLGGKPAPDPRVSDSATADESLPSDPDSTSQEPTTPPTTQNTKWPAFDQPPPVILRYGAESKALEAHTYCFGNVCADGAPPNSPPSVGSPEQVLIDFPLKQWSFEAIFEPAGERCGRMQTVALERNESGSFVLEPAGYAGTYDVTLFGRGNGDLFTTFRWFTPYDGALPTPEARLALVSGDSGHLHSYGVELAVSNLAETPDRASATVTVTAANGASLTFQAARANGCRPEGTVYWDGPDAEGKNAAELGPPPFAYSVDLELDGERYTATAHWPADEIRGNEPSVALRFRPALPALSPR